MVLFNWKNRYRFPQQGTVWLGKSVHVQKMYYLIGKSGTDVNKTVLSDWGNWYRCPQKFIVWLGKTYNVHKNVLFDWENRYRCPQTCIVWLEVFHAEWHSETAWVSVRTFHIYCPIWVKFGSRRLRILLLSVCELHAKRHSDDCDFLVWVNKITFISVPSNRVAFLKVPNAYMTSHRFQFCSTTTPNVFATEQEEVNIWISHNVPSI